VKLNVPETVGVPLIRPVPAVIVNPLGSEPAVTAQLYGNVPPETTTVWLYMALTVPAGREVVVITGAPAMVIESGFVAVAPTLSVTRTMKLEPAPDGVPLITPVPEFNDRPDGSTPEAMDQLSGAVPP